MIAVVLWWTWGLCGMGRVAPGCNIRRAVVVGHCRRRIDVREVAISRSMITREWTPLVSRHLFKPWMPTLKQCAYPPVSQTLRPAALAFVPVAQ